MWRHRAAILAAFHSHRVMVLSGATGSGVCVRAGKVWVGLSFNFSNPGGAGGMVPLKDPGPFIPPPPTEPEALLLSLSLDLSV